MKRVICFILAIAIVGIAPVADAGCVSRGVCAALFGGKKPAPPPTTVCAGANNALDFSNSCNLIYMETMLR
jgi:hypothetical protein